MKRKGESFYIFGKKPVEEQLLRNPDNVMRIFVSDSMAAKNDGFRTLREYAKDKRIPVSPITRNKIKDYVGEVNDQGVIALIKQPDYIDYDVWERDLDMDQMPGVIILDHIEDVHNFGAIIRTAAGAGISGIIVAKDHQAPVNGISYKTSAGAVVKVPIIRVANINQTIERLKEKRFWIAAIDSEETEHKNNLLWNQSFDTPMAFILGSEGKGVSHRTKELSDFIISIPMENNLESLNVSVAAAIIMYEWKRQIDTLIKK